MSQRDILCHNNLTEQGPKRSPHGAQYAWNPDVGREFSGARYSRFGSFAKHPNGILGFHPFMSLYFAQNIDILYILVITPAPGKKSLMHSLYFVAYLGVVNGQEIY